MKCTHLQYSKVILLYRSHMGYMHQDRKCVDISKIKRLESIPYSDSTPVSDFHQALILHLYRFRIPSSCDSRVGIL